MAAKSIEYATFRNISDIKQLPEFAVFIRDKKINEFVDEQLRLSRELDLPLLKFFAHYSEDELKKISIQGSTELLNAFADNKIDEYLKESLRQWTANQLPMIQKENVSADDLALVPYIRKQAFLKLIPDFVQSPSRIVSLIAEIDNFVLQSERGSLDTYINMMQEDAREHLHFVQKIANASPGLIYVYDDQNKSQIFISNKDVAFEGYSYEDLKSIGSLISSNLVHEDDMPLVLAHMESLPSTKDAEIRTVEFRMRNKSGDYRWMSAYETVFKRQEDGTLWQTIGVILDIHKEKSTSEALKRRDEQLRETQRIAGLGSFEWDLTGSGNSQYSDETLNIFSLSQGTKNTEEYLQYVHPADRNAIKDALNKAFEGDGIYECEYRYEKDKPKVIWSKGFVTFEEGKATRMKGFVMDVTERHALTQKLLRSERLYKQAEAQTHTGNWVYNLRTHELEWSDELYRLYGLPVGSVVSREMAAALNNPEDKALIAQKMEEALIKKEPVDFLYRIRAKGEPEKIVRTIGQYMFDENGEPFKWFGTVQDVTKEKLLEKDVLDKKNFIQKIADAAPSIIAAYNVNTGKYIFVSKALEKLLGYEPEIALENGTEFFLDIMHPDDLQTIMEANQQALDRANRHPLPEEESVMEFKYRMRHINGEYLWFHTYGTVFSRNADGKVEEILNISVDITELENASSELHSKNTELAQSNSNLEEFAYVASHDLKEPLRKISTFGDRLQTTQGALLEDSGRDYLSKIIDSANRMQIMVNDLLSVSLISSEKTFEVTDLNEVLKDALRILEYKIEAKNALIHADELPSARIVVSQFRQLFQNLLSNSLKFAKENQQPIINIRANKISAHDLPEHRLDPALSYIKLEFSDNGIGFENQFSEKIFAIFQRLHNRSEYEGTGIGLAICKKVVEHHKGIIFASGTPGVGATFTIIMPI